MSAYWSLCLRPSYHAGEAGPEPTTVIGPRSDLMQSMHDQRSVQAGCRGGLTDSRRHSVESCLPSKPATSPSTHRRGPRNGRVEEAAGLMLKRAIGVHLWGHLSSTSMFCPAQRTLSRIADS